jgi:hypothetical protein
VGRRPLFFEPRETILMKNMPPCCLIITSELAEGLMVAADEPNARKHMELENIPNLQVRSIPFPPCSAKHMHAKNIHIIAERGRAFNERCGGVNLEWI